MKDRNILFIILFLFTIFTYLFIDPNFRALSSVYTGIAYSQRLLITGCYVILITILFFLYYLFVKKSNRYSYIQLRYIIIVCLSILLFSYPAMLSYDIFNYTTTSKVAFYYHENPYIIKPENFINEEFLTYTRAANKVALYGPLWIILTGLPFFMGFGNILLNLLSTKILIGIFYIGIVSLIWKLTKDTKSVILFGLHPLILIQAGMSGHNDVVMMFLCLASYTAALRKRYLLAIILFVSSILIKYATIILLPLFIYIVLSTLRNKVVNKEKVFLISSALLFSIFLLSAFREEIYSWYAIWFMSFTALLPKYKKLQTGIFIFSYSLLLRDIPYILTGSYTGWAPLFKTGITFIPTIIYMVLIVLHIFSIKKRKDYIYDK